MHLKPKMLNIPSDTPFVEDTLSRKNSAEILTQLLSTLREPFVLAIDSPWGTGKTTFLKMLMPHLQKHDFHCLYFNAWDSDFTGDPLVSFIGELRGGLEVSKHQSDSATKTYLDKGKNLLTVLAKKSAPLAVKLLSQGVLNLEGLANHGIEELAESLAKEKLEQYESDKMTIAEFRSALAQYVKEKTKEKEGKKPLIVFVDELDRCRPSYAVDLLEKVKHFFSVEGLVFVLAIDKVQLSHSMRVLYGSGMDIDGYLRRFIDLEYQLPKPTRLEFCKSLCERLNLAEFEKQRANLATILEDFVEAFTMLADAFGLSLRATEQCFGRFNVVLRTTPSRFQLRASLAALLLALKAKDSRLYQSFSTAKPSLDELRELLASSPVGQQYWESYFGLEVEAAVAMGKGNNIDSSFGTAPYLQIIKDQGSNSAEGQRAQKILEITKQFESLYLSSQFAALSRRIELAEKFSNL